jgi:hypothetical protein
VTLGLERIVGGGCALNLDLGSLQLEGLLRTGGKCKHTGNDKSRTNVLRSDLVIVIYFVALENDLHALEVRAVVQVNKSKRLGISEVSDPTAQRNNLAAKAFGTFVNFSDKLSFHFFFSTGVIVIIYYFNINIF